MILEPCFKINKDWIKVGDITELFSFGIHCWFSHGISHYCFLKKSIFIHHHAFVIDLHNTTWGPSDPEEATAAGLRLSFSTNCNNFFFHLFFILTYHHNYYLFIIFLFFSFFSFFKTLFFNTVLRNKQLAHSTVFLLYNNHLKMEFKIGAFYPSSSDFV